MAKSKKTAEPISVTAYIQNLQLELSNLVAAIRQVILNADKEIGEHIKWNSPAFYYTGQMQEFDPKEYKRDIAVINLTRGYPLIILPTGEKIITATTILEGEHKDGRRMITIKSIEELKEKENQLQEILKEWLQLVDR